VANILKINEKRWECSNGYFHVMYEELKEISANQEISFREAIDSLIDSLDQELYGIGCISRKLTNYLTKPEEWLEFAGLVKQAAGNAARKYEWPDSFVAHANALYAMIMEHAEESKRQSQ
jgi:hypothetical protein